MVTTVEHILSLTSKAKTQQIERGYNNGKIGEDQVSIATNVEFN
jgi:hypothetical protein